MSGYRVESSVLNGTQELEKSWCNLQQDADYSYFLSWGWIETWLNLIAIELQPVVVSAWHEDKLIGLGLFVSKDIKRRIVFQSRAMLLNEYPFNGNNMVTECNGLLVARGHEREVYAEVITHLILTYKKHDEYCFGAVLKETAGLITGYRSADSVCLLNEESDYHYVDLSEFDTGIDNYLASLSRNRRGQIRRSIRIYDEGGALKIEAASGLEQALHFFDRLKVLHTNYWQTKDKGGSFANPLWEKFQRTLIKNRFGVGEIQLLKVSNQQGEIAYLYNIVLHKHVYVVQTGFVQSQDKRLMPGYVAHSMAIAYNKSKAMTCYDLMHGDALYKRILCNRSSKLQWPVIQRRRLKFTVEKILVSAVRALRKISA